MENFDNVNRIVGEDLKQTIGKGSKVSVASAVFSIYAYQELKKQLENTEEFRFIFTSPAFIQEKVPKERKEFYIPRITSERSIYGTEFEVRLRNELTQKAISRECAEWIRKKAEFRSNKTNRRMNNFVVVSSGDKCSKYAPMEGFTSVCGAPVFAYILIGKSYGFGSEIPICAVMV